MALGVKTKFRIFMGISITWNSHWRCTTEKPVGLVYIGIASPNDQSIYFRYTFGSKRMRSLIRYLKSYA